MLRKKWGDKPAPLTMSRQAADEKLPLPQSLPLRCRCR